MTLNITLPNDKKFVEILSGYRDFFTKTGHAEEATFYDDIIHSVCHEEAIEIKKLETLARITTTKATKKTYALPDLLPSLPEITENAYLKNEYAERANAMKEDYIYIVGFVAIYTQAFDRLIK